VVRIAVKTTVLLASGAVAKELRAWAVPGDRFYDRDFQVVGWTARKNDHAD
jgi:hypothetical protein